MGKTRVKDLKVNDTVMIPSVKGILTVEYITELNEDECVIKFYNIRFAEILNKYTEVAILPKQ